MGSNRLGSAFVEKKILEEITGWARFSGGMLFWKQPAKWMQLCRTIPSALLCHVWSLGTVIQGGHVKCRVWKTLNIFCKKYQAIKQWKRGQLCPFWRLVTSFSHVSLQRKETICSLSAVDKKIVIGLNFSEKVSGCMSGRAKHTEMAWSKQWSLHHRRQ